MHTDGVLLIHIYLSTCSYQFPSLSSHRSRRITPRITTPPPPTQHPPNSYIKKRLRHSVIAEHSHLLFKLYIYSFALRCRFRSTEHIHIFPCFTTLQKFHPLHAIHMYKLHIRILLALTDFSFFLPFFLCSSSDWKGHYTYILRIYTQALWFFI